MKNSQNTVLMWNPETGDVLLKPWPERDRLHRDYCTGLACYAVFHGADFETRKLMVLTEALHLMVRDGIDPHKLHRVLLGLEEYRDACADDMPGMRGSP